MSATNPHHINAMDMNRDYGDGGVALIVIVIVCFAVIVGDTIWVSSTTEKKKGILHICN